MNEKRAKRDRKRYSGFGGIAEAGGTIPWLVIKTVQGAAKMLRKLRGKE